MRKRPTIDLDQELVREAASVLGTTRTTDTVHAALSDVVRRRRRQDLFEVRERPRPRGARGDPIASIAETPRRMSELASTRVR